MQGTAADFPQAQSQRNFVETLTTVSLSQSPTPTPCLPLPWCRHHVSRPWATTSHRRWRKNRTFLSWGSVRWVTLQSSSAKNLMTCQSGRRKVFRKSWETTPKKLKICDLSGTPFTLGPSMILRILPLAQTAWSTKCIWPTSNSWERCYQDVMLAWKKSWPRVEGSPSQKIRTTPGVVSAWRPWQPGDPAKSGRRHCQLELFEGCFFFSVFPLYWLETLPTGKWLLERVCSCFSWSFVQFFTLKLRIFSSSEKFSRTQCHSGITSACDLRGHVAWTCQTGPNFWWSDWDHAVAIKGCLEER